MGRRISVKQELRCFLHLGDVKKYSTALFNEGCAFLLGKDVAYGLLLRRANSVRPYRFVAVGVVFQSFYIQFSSFKQGAGSAFLCDQNLSSCSPNSR